MKTHLSWQRLMPLALIALLFLAACGGQAQPVEQSAPANTPEPAPTATAVPAATEVIEATAVAEEETSTETAPPAPEGTLRYILNYLPGENWVEGKPLIEQDITHHTEYMQGAFDEDVLLRGGPIMDEDRGLYLVEVADEAALDAFLQADPGVTSGLFTVEVDPWFVIFDQALGAMADGMSFFTLSYTPGENWVEGKPLIEQNIAHHTEFMQGLFAEGKLLSGGPVLDEDRGFYLMLAADAAELQALLADDPGLTEGLFVNEMHPWFVVFDQDTGMTPAVLAAASAAAEETAVAQQPEFAINHFILDYTAGENWVEGKPLIEQDISHHTEYMQGLLADGTLALGGPVLEEDRGQYVIAVETAAEVEAILAADPGITDGIFVAEMTPWVALFDQPTNSETAADLLWFTLSYTPGENWVEGKPLIEQELAHHTEYMQGLFADGILIKGGPIAGENKGFYVIAITNATEVDAILENDPGVIDGLFATAVTPWFVIFDASVSTN